MSKSKKKYPEDEIIRNDGVDNILVEFVNGTCMIQPGDICDVMQCTDQTGKLYISTSHAVDGSTCFFRCANETFTTWKTCSDGIWSLNVENGDRDPPTIICPPNIQKVSDDLQDHATVKWTEPIANDNGTPMRATRHGLAPGLQFSKGVTKISYSARDSSGNMGTCSFLIIITVPICPGVSVLKNGWYMCHTSFEMRKGTQCNFGCYEGHRIVGDSSIKCMESATWTGQQPVCIPVTCDTLAPPQDMKLSCSDKNNFRSKCSYSCREGFDISPGMSRVRVCASNGEWRGKIPTCTDILPPVITNCTGAIYGFADRGSVSGRFVWDNFIPSVYDNADKAIRLMQTAGPDSFYNNLTAGTYDVTFDATDSSGNKAFQCKMKIVMKVLRCPKVYSLPLQTVICEGGSKFGAECKFSCANGSVINGLSQAMCEKEGNGQYVTWKRGSHQPFCEAQHLCEDRLEPPSHGAVACDYWLGGKFCQMLCRNGYDVPAGYLFREMYVCGESGSWTPDSKLPNCARTHSSHHAIAGISVDYYFDGDCRNATVADSIRQKFVQALSQSAYMDACKTNEESCFPRNVEVKCGSHAGKRSASISIGFELEISSRTAFGNRSFAKLNEKMKTWLGNVSDEKATFDIHMGDNVTLIVQEVHNNGLRIVCDGRTIPSYTSESCIECPPGTFYDTKAQVCPLCPAGQYQPSSAQLDCIQCPNGRSTRRKGAQSKTECEVACAPGTYSKNGLPPCSLCEIGRYTNVYGSMQCSSCSGSRTTIHEGETSETSCKEFDLIISSKIGNVVLPLNSSLIRSESFIVSFWMKLQDNRNLSSVIRILYPDKEFDIGLNGSSFMFTGFGFQATSDLSVNDTKWHSLAINVNNSCVDIFLDSELIIPQQNAHNQATHSSNADPSIIIAGGDFMGSISQLNIWSHRYTIGDIVKESSYCHSRTQGDILGWKQFESVDNDHVFLQIPSECDDHDDCTRDACNEGVCVDGLHTYSCDCPFGLKGDNCEFNIDDCVDNVCENNSTCIDGVGRYTCHCDVNFKGELCEIAVVDGKWSTWSNWSTCSTTCGEGIMTRIRLCNSPTPDNGGKDCPGDTFDQDTCMLEQCTACTNLTTPAHAALDCQWTTSEDAVTCSLSCENGYDFDHAAKEIYRCGPDTFHLWDFQTDDNPYGRLPDCTRKVDGNTLNWKYMASYIDLVCDSDPKADIVERKIKKAVYEGVESLKCKRHGSCSLTDIQVTGCSGDRFKRSASPTTAGFAADFTCDSQKFTSDGCRDVVTEVLNEMLAKIEGNAFNTLVDGLEYSIMENSSMFGGRSYCKAGMVPVQHYCVPCSRGRFNSGDECEKCALGTYQNQIGQTLCINCPVGYTTEGRASVDVEDCNVAVNIPSDTGAVPAWKYGVPIGLSIGFGVVCVVSILLWRKIRGDKNKREIKSTYELFDGGKGMTASKPKYIAPPVEMTPVADDNHRADSSLKESLSTRNK
ncbi:uncharacterized protein LOC132543962 [Ylistrum balloti]|uniref:uncharacterized protein LOC132543962 n=1 Tax=Ylistrum balloti TaxID=509963 RepID=UPI0029059DDD|nr:uncharacterized protein LOC132543962 [Ylistrum balloti]